MKIDMNAWNQTEAADMGGFKRLPAGGYVCRVQAVREDKSMRLSSFWTSQRARLLVTSRGITCTR